MPDILSMVIDCLDDLSKGNPSPNTFRDRIAALRAEASRDIVSTGNESKDSAEGKNESEVKNAVG